MAIERFFIMETEGCEALVRLPYTDQKPFYVNSETFEKTYQTNEPLFTKMGVDTVLQKLLDESGIRTMLFKEINNFENIVIHRDYPLSETMFNLGYSKEVIEEIDRKISYYE